MVGRRSELRLLADAFDRAVRDETCILFTVLGQAGVGKSRLVEEFSSTIATGTQVLRGRCLSYGDGITYWPIVEMITSAADLSDTDPPEFTLAKITALLEGVPEAAVIAQRLGQILGLAGAAASPAPRRATSW
jgi:predicted ATPase